MHESRMVDVVVQDDDVVLDLGAGLGLISTVAYKTYRAAAIHSYEADPRLPPLIAETHRLNGVRGVHVTHAAVTSDAAAVAAGSIRMHLRSSFWANSIHAPKGANTRRAVAVPVVSLAAIMQDVRPTVIFCDIEGAEVGLFDGVDLSGVRHVIVEVHPEVTGLGGVTRVFDALRAAGLVYDPWLSEKAVPGFTRLEG
jgi:FkbM family methyltransferase